MGLNSRGGRGSNKTYINIYAGNLVLEYPTQEALERKLEILGLEFDTEKVSESSRLDTICLRQKLKGKNEGKDVFYYILRDVGGYITDITLNENDFGEFLGLEFTDVDEKFEVSLGDVGSRMAIDFVRRMGGLDLNEEVVMGVWNISAEEADNGKAKSGVRMYQDDAKIEYFIEYDELPEPITKKKGRKTVWDFSEQETYLYEALIEWRESNFSSSDVSEKLPEKEAPKAKATPNKRKARVPVESTTEEDDNDMPF